MTAPLATVLVVDDEPELLEIFEAWLERAGYRVLTAPNGAEALAILTTQKIDALVSDIRMPIMDGPSLVRAMHNAGITTPTIVFVSGFGDINLREMHALGVETTLEKPVNRKTLIAVVEDSLTGREKLWLTPLPIPCRRRVEAEILQSTISGPHFDLGRGGCCFASTESLARHETIQLTLRFSDPPRRLNAQGEVRWYDPGSRYAGVAFRYLDPDCRSWIISAIETANPRSFIPSGLTPPPAT